MKVSIIIPTLNEEEHLPKLLSVLMKERARIQEIIVVDASSEDQTVAIAQQADVILIQSDIRRRAFQLSLGGSIATGDILYFIHADTIPPQGFIDEIISSIKGGTTGGCFRLKFDPSSRFLRFFEVFVGIPWLVCRGGDQSLFISHEAYKTIGGFNGDLPIMEDIDIIKKIAKLGVFSILQKRVKTSSRRYIKYGEWKLQWAFAIVHLLYWLKLEPTKIKTWIVNYLDND